MNRTTRTCFSVDRPHLAIVKNYGYQLEADPALGGRFNEAVFLMIRPGTPHHDESGESGSELFHEVVLTRTQMRSMLDGADQLWLDTCAAGLLHPRTGKSLRRFSAWRVWAAIRRLRWRGTP